MDISALTGCLEREEKARTEEAAEHATSAAALQKNIADLQVCILQYIVYLFSSRNATELNKPTGRHQAGHHH